MKDKLINLLLLLTVTFLGVNLIRSFMSISQKGKIIGDEQKKLIETQDENSRLNRELVRIENPEYVEKQAREKLNLGKQGEYVIILPTISLTPTPEANQSYANWEEWLNLFR